MQDHSMTTGTMPATLTISRESHRNARADRSTGFRPGHLTELERGAGGFRATQGSD